jgi:CHAT domain-containing protein/tetratricopeptide (TPR) repeat protein
MMVRTNKILSLMTIVLGWLAAVAAPAYAQRPAQIEALQQQLTELHAQGRYAEAIDLGRRILADLERMRPPNQRDIAAAVSNLASINQEVGNYKEAEALYKRSLAMNEKLNLSDPGVGDTLSGLAGLYRVLGRFADARPLLERSLAIAKASGDDHLDVALVLDNLAQLYDDQGRYAEAELLYKRSVRILEQARGADDALLATALNNLAGVYIRQERVAEAETFIKRSLEIREKKLDPRHPAMGTSLNNLGEVRRAQGRDAEAEALLKRGLEIREAALGADHPVVGDSLGNLAALYFDLERYDEAEALNRRALSVREAKLGKDHPRVGLSAHNLAQTLKLQGRLADAEPLYHRSLAIREKILGRDHPDVATTLDDLAALYLVQKRYADAESLFNRSLKIRETIFGPEHARVGRSFNNLAVLHFLQANWGEVAKFGRRSTALGLRGLERGTADVGRARTSRGTGFVETHGREFRSLIKAAHRMALQDPSGEATLTREMFEIAQWTQHSEAARSLAQMAARGAKGDPALAGLVRDREDLVDEWQKLESNRTASLSRPSNQRDGPAEAAAASRLAAIDALIGKIDQRLLADFPDYAALARPTSLSVEGVQTQLGDEEALVLFADTPSFEPTAEESFIWVITKTASRWRKTGFPLSHLTREVAALRCGLDTAAWESEGAHKCSDLVANSSHSLVFDTARAHRLYKALFGQVEELIAGKQLLIVPSGPLTQLPFQVLVTAAPTNSDYRPAAWLVRSHQITILPAVSSLKALRRIAKASRASKPMIGVGNPLLDGNPAARPWEAEWAQLAREKQVCEHMRPQQIASLDYKRRSSRSFAMGGGRVDLDLLRSQAPLHDTTDELCAVAKDLGSAREDILLGDKATEANIKKLSSEQKLAAYRVVHFATHGVMAGELEADSEPGLILTPPSEQSDLDDGYLSASEVSSLKLDADWAILSACNTAAGGSDKAEALSGLARAFFYAGARSMLVSHWAVNSAATVKLITSAVGATARDNRLGRAEALRRAMLSMIDKGKEDDAHPANWAPFVLVGEGSVR